MHLLRLIEDYEDKLKEVRWAVSERRKTCDPIHQLVFVARGATLQALTTQVSSQAVMMATNPLMTLCAIGFAIAAFTIWLAPRPRAGVDVSAVH